MRQHFYTLLILKIFLVSACAIDKPETPIVVTEIAKEFSLQMRETLDTSGRAFILRVSTIKAYDCSNYAIQYIWRSQGNALLLSLLRIAAPFTCDHKPGKIHAETNAGELGHGNYPIAVDLRGAVINKGTLSVQPDRYQLRLDTEHGLVIEQKDLMRIPAESVWGYVTFTPDSKNLALSLVQEIFDLSQPIELPKGFYGYYSIDENGLSVEGQPADASAYPFLRRSAADHGAIAATIKKYRNLYPTALQIVVRDGKGRQY
jgi:hypothetical protein